jgi:hypothetical protein
MHADLGERIAANQREAEKLTDDAKSIEAVIRLFNAERRPLPRNPWFRHGTMFRSALEALRTATVPMTAREITAAVIVAKGITDATNKQRRSLETAIRTSLQYNAGKVVQPVGEGSPKRWRIL